MNYISIADAYRTAGISNEVIKEDDVLQHIYAAENAVLRDTKNIYWDRKLENQTVSSAADNSLTQLNAQWAINKFSNCYIWIFKGKGKDQIRQVTTNTADTINIDRDWDENPDDTSRFRIFYVPEQFNPFLELTLDGTDTNTMIFDYYPIVLVEKLVSNDIEISVDKLLIWNKVGRIRINQGAEYSLFFGKLPQKVEINYWYGVDYLPYEIKRLVELKAAIQMLSQQMGGTYNVPSTISLPDSSISIGQAYINIKTSQDTMIAEYDKLLEKTVKIYPVFG